MNYICPVKVEEKNLTSDENKIIFTRNSFGAGLNIRDGMLNDLSKVEFTMLFGDVDEIIENIFKDNNIEYEIKEIPSGEKVGAFWVVDWSKVDKTDYLLAMERSPIKDTEIKELLKQSLTDKIDDREVYMKGIDNSYLYEGYLSFKTEEL